MGKKTPSKTIVQRSMTALGLSYTMKTDPQIIESVLEEMELDDFKTTFPPMKKFFKEIKTKPKSLRPMFKNIEKGLVTKQPAIIEFLALALKKKWLKESEEVQRAIHITLILEAMTAAMCNSHTFFLEATSHYREKEKALGLDRRRILKTTSAVWGMFHDVFGVAKMLALDPLMIFLRIGKGIGDDIIPKKELKKMYRSGEINYFEYNLLYKLCKHCPGPSNKLVRINIYEAGTTEYKHGIKDNAVCAYALSKDLEINSPKAAFKIKNMVPDHNTDPFYRTISQKDNLFLDIDASQGWASLYTTWNMAFILGNLENLDLLFPKLIMPSIINAKHNNFLTARVVSLWLTINHALFRYSKKIKVTGPKNKVQMAKAWAKINKKYALAFADAETHIGSRELMRGYHEFFMSPIHRILAIALKIFQKICGQ